MARKQRRTSLGVLFWIAFILLVVVVFLVNRPQIQTVLDNTGLVDVISERVSSDQGDEQEIPSEEDSETGDETVEPLPDELPGPDDQPDETEEPPVPSDEPEDRREPEEPQDGDEQEEAEGEITDEASDAEAEQPEPDSRTRRARLYYVRVTDDGAFPEAVSRTIEYTDRPLTATIEELIAGPNGEEGSNGLLNLIPDGTRLRSARVSNGVAYLDFNEAFRFNTMGVEGYRMQLKQIVFATTEFETVDRVQFLIEGERREWLGGEGVYIGTPLGRDSLS